MASSTILCGLLFFVALPAFTQQTKPKAKPPTAVDDSDKEMQLRVRLNFDHHDKEAHKQLIEILDKKYAFRAEMEADGNWLKDNPDDYLTEIEMSSLAKTISDPEYAITIDHVILAKANRADDPEDYDYVSDRMAFLLERRGRNAEALSLLKLGTVESPNDFGAWYNLAEVEGKMGQYDSAVSHFRKSLDIDANQEATHEALSGILYKKGDIAGARTEMIAAIAVYNAQYKTGTPTDSFHDFIKKMQEIDKVDRGLAELNVKLGKLYLADKHYAEALRAADDAIKADNTDYSYLYFRAEVLDATSQSKAAAIQRAAAHQMVVDEMVKEKAKQKPTAKPQEDDFLSEVSYPELVFLMKSDDEEPLIDGAHEVILLLEPVLATGKLKSLDYVMLAQAYCEKGQPAKCRRLMEAGFNADPKLNTSTLHYSLAQGLQKDGDLSGAAAHFQSAYELDPQNTTYRYDYEASRSSEFHP